ncbi:MAG: hypothetical protein VXU48_02585 [Verrucomicrobiota bacterium]|nr:hypothetical protein [Verrucomicrobiota bacterium]
MACLETRFKRSYPLPLHLPPTLPHLLLLLSRERDSVASQAIVSDILYPSHIPWLTRDASLAMLHRVRVSIVTNYRLDDVKVMSFLAPYDQFA